jgi:hypothetical protein
MAIAKGSKSQVIWKEESSYGVAPSGNWNQQPLNSETLDENINTVQGEDIRADRANPSLRGGNINTVGGITHDLGPVRSLTFFRHLLASASLSTTTLTVVAIAVSTVYNRGDYVLGVGTTMWCCVRGGSTTASAGDIVLNTTLGTRIELTELSAGPTLIFELVSTTVVPVYEHILVPGVDFPAVGITMAKKIVGGNSPLYVNFTGCRMNSCDITVPQEGIVKAAWNIAARRSAKVTIPGGTPTLLAEDPFAGFNGYVHYNGDAKANANRAMREWNATITNNVAEDCFVIGDRFHVDLPEGTRRASGRVSTYFLDSTEYDHFKNEDKITMDVSFIRLGLFLKIAFAEVKMTGSGTPKISGQGAMTADYEWTAFKQDSTNEMQITARNLTAAASIPV